MKKLNLALLAAFLASSATVQASLVDQEDAAKPSVAAQVMEDVKIINTLLAQAHDHKANGVATDREEIAIDVLVSIKESLISSKTKENFMVTLEKAKAIWAKEAESTEVKSTWSKIKNMGKKVVKTDWLFKTFVLKTAGYMGLDLAVHVGPKVAKLIIKEMIASMTKAA